MSSFKDISYNNTTKVLTVNGKSYLLDNTAFGNSLTGSSFEQVTLTAQGVLTINGTEIALPIVSAPEDAILDSNDNYIMASDGYLTTTEVSGYTVTVINNYSMSSDTVIYDGQDDTDINLGTIAYGETKTFTITSGYIYQPLFNATFCVSSSGGSASAGNPYAISSDITLYIIHNSAIN